MSDVAGTPGPAAVSAGKDRPGVPAGDEFAPLPAGLASLAGPAAEVDIEVQPTPRRHPWRWVAWVVVVVLAAMLVHAVAFNSNFGWSIVGQYLFAHQILFGLLRTLELTAVAMIIGIVGGTVLATMRLSESRLISGSSWLYIWFFRGTPVLVQLLFWYNLGYLYPHLSIGIPFGPTFWSISASRAISSLTAAIFGLGLNEAAYMSEIVRAGITSVDVGQTDAALAVGMSKRMTMNRIILPQAMRYIIPPTGNELIGMLKTTALVSVVALAELLYSAQQIYTQNYEIIPLLVVVSIWYLVVTSILMVLQGRLERYYGRGSGKDYGARLLRVRLPGHGTPAE